MCRSIPFAHWNRCAGVCRSTYTYILRNWIGLWGYLYLFCLWQGVQKDREAAFCGIGGYSFMSDWKLYYFVGTVALYSIWWIRHRLHLTIQAAVVRHAPELQWKSMYRYHTKHEWMPIHFILHSPRSHNMVCFVLPSCCTTAGQWSCCSSVLPNTIAHCMVTYDGWVLYSVPAPHTLLRSFGRHTKQYLWPIRHWGGQAHFKSLVFYMHSTAAVFITTLPKGNKFSHF